MSASPSPNEHRGWKYVVVSPVRDEIKHIEATIDSMEKQTIQPIIWIVVDDGSTDGTTEFLFEAAKRYTRLRVVRRSDRGFRQAGAGIVEAFREGLAQCDGMPCEFIVKLDGDLSFDADYFERCLGEFQREPRLGIGGGTICNNIGGRLEPESKVDPLFHVRGATKIYRRACWAEIGGLIPAPGWDAMDELKANMLGWMTRTFPGINVLHHRQAGAAYGRWRDWKKGGLGNYIAGYHPLFMAAKCVRRLFVRPYFIASAALLSGFVSGYLRRVPQIDDKRLVQFVRREQLNKLLGRKSLWVH